MSRRGKEPACINPTAEPGDFITQVEGEIDGLLAAPAWTLRAS